jgi:hypothetical protein
MATTDFQKAEINKQYFRSGTSSKPTVWAVALHSGAPGADGTANELSGGDYARVDLPPSDSNWGAVSSGTFSNLAEIEFAEATTDWTTVTHFSIWDATTGGNARYTGPLNASKSVSTGQTAKFAVGAITVTLT